MTKKMYYEGVEYDASHIAPLADATPAKHPYDLTPAEVTALATPAQPNPSVAGEPFTAAEIDENPRLTFEPEEWIRRADGKVVRVDRWEWGIRNIVSTLWGPRHQFEISEVVERVEALAAGEPAITVQAEAADPMNYKGMFLDAVKALADIDALLGLPEDGCNDPQVTVSALADYIAGARETAKYRDQWVDAQYSAGPQSEEERVKDAIEAGSVVVNQVWFTRPEMERAVRHALATPQPAPAAVQQPVGYLHSDGKFHAVMPAWQAEQPTPSVQASEPALLAIDHLIAKYHAEVWAAAEGETPCDYDMAGVETAKQLRIAIAALVGMEVSKS